MIEFFQMIGEAVANLVNGLLNILDTFRTVYLAVSPHDNLLSGIFPEQIYLFIYFAFFIAFALKLLDLLWPL